MKTISFTNTTTRPSLKFADTTLDHWRTGDLVDPHYTSNIRIKRTNEYTGEEYFWPLFQIYSYTILGGARIWGLNSPKFEKHPKFYKDFQTALKWAGKIYETLELVEEAEIHNSYRIHWMENTGTRKSPVWEDHYKHSFCYANPAITY